jgi:hypothetical protein
VAVAISSSWLAVHGRLNSSGQRRSAGQPSNREPDGGDRPLPVTCTGPADAAGAGALSLTSANHHHGCVTEAAFFLSFSVSPGHHFVQHAGGNHGYEYPSQPRVSCLVSCLPLRGGIHRFGDSGTLVLGNFVRNFW